jgi:pimeloyl-ACP methyl ester carboxylesterase
VQALKAASGEPVLPLPAYHSMLPGNVAFEAAQIDVPVFLGVGERDMVGPPHQVPAAFTKSSDVTLLVLPEAGHSHFLFPSRKRLFDRLATWARSVLTEM